MADLSEVQNALVALAAQTLYPNGTGNPSSAVVPIRIRAGWPNPKQLEDDLKIGTCHVTVFPRAEERNTTRFARQWIQSGNPAHTITLAIDEQTVTVGGTIPASDQIQNLAIIANGKSFTYTATDSDTLTTIAAALAALADAEIDGTSNAGPVITFPATARVTETRVGGTATFSREIRRQERIFQITIWADTPTHRDSITNALDLAMADTPFLTMPDGFAARLRYRSSPNNDNYQLERLYRRDLWYSVDYATTQTDTATEVITVETDLLTNDDLTPVKHIVAEVEHV